MRKRLNVFLIAMLIGGLVSVNMTHFGMVGAEIEITKPSSPEFTVQLIDSSYNIPPTSSVDPYTGLTATQVERHIESRTIKLSIKNQPFTPFLVEEATANWTANLQYNIRWKGSFEQDWHEIYIPTNGFAGAHLESEYTVISFEGEYSATEGLKLHYPGLIATFPPSGQVDFQVKAMIGYVHRDPLALGWIFTGEESEWSNTQTITVDEGSVEVPEQSPVDPAQSSTQNQFGAQSAVTHSGIPWTEIGLFALFSGIIAALLIALIYKRKAIQRQLPSRDARI